MEFHLERVWMHVSSSLDNLGKRVRRPKVLQLGRALLIGVAITSQAQASHYVYDSMHRLTRVVHADGITIDYVYDSLGNRLKQTTTLPGGPTNRPPAAVTDPSVANGAFDVSLTPFLGWLPAVDPDNGDSVVYYVYFGTVVPLPLVFSGSATNWSPGLLRGSMTYYWQVVARDNHNAQTIGPLWQFYTGNEPPVARFSATPTNGMAPLLVRFTDRSSDWEGGLASWEWDFDGDSVVDSTERNTAFVYPNPGDYTVTLTVQDDAGAATTKRLTNYVHVSPSTIVDLAPTQMSVQSAGSYRHLSIAYSITNLTTNATGAVREWMDTCYLTTNGVRDAQSPQIGIFYERQAILGGGTYRRTNLITLPSLTGGTNYLHFVTDFGSQIAENNDNNNSITIALSVTNLPDLKPISAQLIGSSAAQQSVQVTYVVTNSGPLRMDADWYDGIYVSSNRVWNTDAVGVAGGIRIARALGSGETYAVTNTATLPNWPPGTYYLIVRCDAVDYIVESTETNNAFSIPIFIGGPDLIPISGAVNPVVRGRSIEVTTAVTNAGSGPSSSYLVNSWFLSNDATWDTSDVLVAQVNQVMALAPGASLLATNRLSLPQNIDGSRYVILWADSYNLLAEASESNNYLALPLTRIPDLQPAALELLGEPVSGEVLNVLMVVTNAGNGIAGGTWSDALYLSTNNVWDAGDLSLGSYSWSANVADGASYRRTNVVTLPKWAGGDYYLIFHADQNNSLYELSDSNNEWVRPITLRTPDLAPVMVAVGSVVSGRSLSVTAVVTNSGNGPAVGGWTDGWYSSSNATWEAGDPLLVSLSQSASVPAGGSYGRTNTIAVPTGVEGSQYLLFRSDYNNAVAEADESNNLIAVAVTNVPDLRPISIELTNGAVSGKSVTLITTITNQGSGIAGGFWSDYVYVSSDATWSSNDLQLTPYNWNLAVSPGQSYRKTNTVTLPTLSPGHYYLILRVDRNNNLYELSDQNNELAIPVEVTVPDLSPLAVTVSPVVIGRSLSVVTVVTNRGNGPALGAWSDAFFWSTNQIWEAGGSLVGTISVSGPSTAGGIYVRTNSVNIPSTTEGSRFLIFKVDNNNAVSETDENNNILAVPVTTLPDLVPSALGWTNGPEAGKRLGIVAAVANNGTGTAGGKWADYLYFSRDAIWDASDLQLAAVTWNSGVATGQTYRWTNIVTLPSVASGIYYLILRVDRNNSLYERSELNNAMAMVLPVVAGQPLLNAVIQADGQALLTVYGPTNAVYVVESTASFSTPAPWRPTPFAVVGRSNFSQTLLPQNATNRPIFFRVSKP